MASLRGELASTLRRDGLHLHYNTDGIWYAVSTRAWPWALCGTDRCFRLRLRGVEEEKGGGTNGQPSGSLAGTRTG